MREGSKAVNRRQLQQQRFYEYGESSEGFDWCPILGGGHKAEDKIKTVLDVGPGDDILVWEGAEVTGFDKPGIPDGAGYSKSSEELGYATGDANLIDEAFPDGRKFDCIHGSQVAEHVHDPTDFINRCIKLLKPNGHLVLTVPDFDLYEKGMFPSRFNPDHKSTWSLWRTNKPSSYPHYYVPHLKGEPWVHGATMIRAALIDTNYDYLNTEDDQTFDFEAGVECFIEMVWRKS